ncbi:MAG: signal peptidase I [Deltaproteobacteria bacterium]|nr:signal peptidase I [Deltaproteobacteria bacterium]
MMLVGNIKKGFRKHVSTGIIVLGVFAFRSSFADQYIVPSGSMEPTIQIGDHVLVNKMAYDLRLPFTTISLARTGEPRRGEVIVFRDPRDPSIRLIKRLIGLPGDRVRVVNGIVEVNGAPLETSLAGSTGIEPVLAAARGRFAYDEKAGGRLHRIQRLPERAARDATELVVPAGRYFFLGDNRDNSADSRVWGFASRDALEGRAFRTVGSSEL